MTNWDAGLYLKFGAERTRPAIDLAARIELAAPARVADLGCGPGNSTAVLRKRWPTAEVTGVDNSPEMIAAARKSDPAGRWVAADYTTWSDDRPFDVVFANASLQWVPDHATLVRRLFGLVAPGGALAAQMPAHFESPLYRLIVEIAQRPGWRGDPAAARKAMTVERPGFYYDALAPQAARLDIWVTEYWHVVENPPAIVTWIRGSGLRPFLMACADDAERAEFERQLFLGVEREYPHQADGRVLFPFCRLFLVAYKAG
jgi:trans-aconitate 2-methyltransferase